MLRDPCERSVSAAAADTSSIMTAGEIFLTALLLVQFMGNLFASGAILFVVLHKKDREDK